MTDGDRRGDVLHRTLDALWRMESPRIVATVARMTRDLGLAEEVVQDAFEAALRQWPTSGVPDRPAAWLMGTARHRAIDAVRRRSTLGRKTEELGRSMTGAETLLDLDAAIDNAAIGDDLLRLVFICCHPVLSSDARVALTLRLLPGVAPGLEAREPVWIEGARRHALKGGGGGRRFLLGRLGHVSGLRQVWREDPHELRGGRHLSLDRTRTWCLTEECDGPRW